MVSDLLRAASQGKGDGREGVDIYPQPTEETITKGWGPSLGDSLIVTWLLLVRPTSSFAFSGIVPFSRTPLSSSPAWRALVMTEVSTRVVRHCQRLPDPGRCTTEALPHSFGGEEERGKKSGMVVEGAEARRGEPINHYP